MLNSVIIDDDQASTIHLESLFKKLPSFDIHLVGKTTNLEDGVELIKRTNPDLLFLDINLPGKNGLEIFNEFTKPSFKIIFCTRYEHYAIDVFRKGSYCYLLKPLDFIALRDAIQKVSAELKQEQIQHKLEDKINFLNTPEMPTEKVLLNTDTGFIVQNTGNIEYCYADASYSNIVTCTGKKITITKSLKELQDLLPKKHFYRTHKSYLVNINYIRSFTHVKNSYVLLKSGFKVPVSVRVASVIKKDMSLQMRT